MKPATRRRIVWGGVALAVVVLIALALKPRPVPVDLATVVRGPLEVTLDHEGITRVRDRFSVSAPVAGRVLRITLEPGDRVTGGETTVAVFEPSEPVFLDARSRAEAEAAVRAVRASLEGARAGRDRALAEHRLALTERERTRRLAGEKIVSREALDSAETSAEAAEKALEAAEAGVRSALHELEVAEARLVGPGDPARGGAVLELRAPVDGVVLRRHRESESVVAAGEPLVEIGDTDDLEIVADFLSTDAVRIRPGMPARIAQWGGGREVAAQVRKVEPSGFMKVSALGVEEQRVNVVADLTAPRGEWESLGDGYRIEMRVVVASKDVALQVPTSALFRHDADWCVFVEEGGRARLRKISIGDRNGLAAEVLEGLAEGDSVVVHPSGDVHDGARIARRATGS